MNKPKETKEEDKKMKKKIKWVVVTIAVLLVGLISACGNTEQPEPAPAAKEEIAEEENIAEGTAEIKEPEVAENNQQEGITDSDNLDAAPENKDYLHLGNVYTNGDGISAEVIDIDYNINGNDVGGNIYTSIGVYVAMEITNNSDNDIYLDQNDAVLFIDDYEIAKEAAVELVQQNGYCIVNNTKQYPTVATIRSGGRKGTIVFVTYVTSQYGVTETSDIDFEISGLIFKVNPRFILNQFAKEVETIEAANDPFSGTDSEGMAPIEAQNGTYTSVDGAIVITVNGDKFSAQRSGNNIIDEALFTPKDSSIPNYYVVSGSGLTVTFFDGGLVIEGLTVDGELFDDRGLDGLYTSDGVSNIVGSAESSSSGIGNPVIDANPDRYIPEGITGKIDVIDGTFYSNKPTSGIVPGEYLIVGCGDSIVTISDDYKVSLKFISGEVDFENADMEELINCTDGVSYQTYGNGTGYVISFYEGGLYLYTSLPDDENDWAEGFYELLN